MLNLYFLTILNIWLAHVDLLFILVERNICLDFPKLTSIVTLYYFVSSPLPEFFLSFAFAQSANWHDNGDMRQWGRQLESPKYTIHNPIEFSYLILFIREWSTILQELCAFRCHLILMIRGCLIVSGLRAAWNRNILP